MRHVLVFDLGGGTLDVVLLSHSADVLEVNVPAHVPAHTCCNDPQLRDLLRSTAVGSWRDNAAAFRQNVSPECRLQTWFSTTMLLCTLRRSKI